MKTNRQQNFLDQTPAFAGISALFAANDSFYSQNIIPLKQHRQPHGDQRRNWQCCRVPQLR
jgi:hypothetical protein